MSYPYEDLDSSQFERLVVQCGKKLFGSGLQGFAPGKDGGRDALFRGTAERHPSSAAPWVGTTVVQAKHTSGFNTHFSDPEFSVNQSSVLDKEIPRVKALFEAGNVDHYMLLANRRLGGITGPEIVRKISQGTGLPEQSVFVGGVEYLDDLLFEYPDVIRLSRIENFAGPLLISSQDMAEVVLGISHLFNSEPAAKDAPTVDRTNYTAKNSLNNMSADFAQLLLDRYLVYTQRFEEFFAHRSNAEILGRYQDAVEEFQLKIIAKRADFESFDDVFNHIVDLLFSRDSVLKRNKALTRAMIFFMYWNCDLGRNATDAQGN